MFAENTVLKHTKSFLDAFRLFLRCRAAGLHPPSILRSAAPFRHCTAGGFESLQLVPCHDRRRPHRDGHWLRFLAVQLQGPHNHIYGPRSPEGTIAPSRSPSMDTARLPSSRSRSSSPTSSSALRSTQSQVRPTQANLSGNLEYCVESSLPSQLVPVMILISYRTVFSPKHPRYWYPGSAVLLSP